MRTAATWVRKARRTTVLVMLSLAAGGAFAHHSGVMYDETKIDEVSGTLKKAQIGFPHSWFWVVVPNEQGGEDPWAFETGSVSQLSHQAGTTIGDQTAISEYFAVGQKVTVKYHPLRDGRKSGELVSMSFKDGRIYMAPSATR